MQNISEFILNEFLLMHPNFGAQDLALEFTKQFKQKFNHIQTDFIQDEMELLKAFSHKSFVNEVKFNIENNERLEFLGDAVLELFVTDLLMKEYPNESEGTLSKLRSSLVNEKSLNSMALALGLDAFILLGKGEIKEKGYEKPSLISDCFEALIGMVYSQKGIDGARQFLSEIFYQDSFKKLWSLESLQQFDAKSRLQEIIMQEFGVHPQYKSSEIMVNKEKQFKLSCWIEARLLGELTHFSKKKGMQLLAKDILENKKYERSENAY
jgi:ribonuclease-3